MRLNPQWVRFAGFVVLIAAFAVVLFWAAPLAWPVLQVIIIALLFILALDPIVRWQMRVGIPRWAAAADLMLVVILIIAFLVYFLIPPIVAQAQEFLSALPRVTNFLSTLADTYLHRIPGYRPIENPSAFLTNFITQARPAVIARSIFDTAVGAVTAVILVFVITFYTLLNPWPLLYGIRGLFPTAWWDTIERVGSASAFYVRWWVIGTIELSIVIGVLDYVALFLINLFNNPNIPFILLFAIIGGLLEVVPVVGPAIATALVTIVGFTISPLTGLLALGAFIIVQQLENHIIAPFVLNRAVNLHPITIIFALIIMAGLFGLFGALIAVPTAAVIKVLYDEWYYPLAHNGERPLEPPIGSAEVEQEMRGARGAREHLRRQQESRRRRMEEEREVEDHGKGKGTGKGRRGKRK